MKRSEYLSKWIGVCKKCECHSLSSSYPPLKYGACCIRAEKKLPMDYDSYDEAMEAMLADERCIAKSCEHYEEMLIDMWNCDN